MTCTTKTAPRNRSENQPARTEKKAVTTLQPFPKWRIPLQHQSLKHKSNTHKTLPSQSTIRHTKRDGHKTATHKDHNNTKPIWQTIVLWNTPCFKLKSKKTAKNSISPIVIPKKNSKVIPKARRSANMSKRISNIHESTRRFNAASRKNTQRTLSL